MWLALVTIVAALAIIGYVRAAGLGDALGKLDQAVGPQTEVGLSGNLPGTIATVIKAALSLVGTIFLLLTIYAGILWMTAQGKEEQIEKAQTIIKTTIIGLFITLAAYAITAFVTGRLTGVGTSSPAAPGAAVNYNQPKCTDNVTGSGRPAVCKPGVSAGGGISLDGGTQRGGATCSLSIGQKDCPSGQICCAD